jgi:hypothetical protein
VYELEREGEARGNEAARAGDLVSAMLEEGCSRVLWSNASHKTHGGMKPAG